MKHRPCFLFLQSAPVEGWLVVLLEANKWVQYQLLAARQLSGDAPANARPKLTGLRTRLDQLQLALLDGLVQTASLRAQRDCATPAVHAASVTADKMKLDELHRDALTRSFGDFCQSRRWLSINRCRCAGALQRNTR